MAKLNQIVAIETGLKPDVYSEVTKLHQRVQKSQLLNGHIRSYKPNDDEGERLPGTQERVQIRANDVLNRVSEILTRLFDVTLTKDVANTQATADVKVNGQVLIAGVPATYLLFLAKQLSDLETFVKKVPTLDESEYWGLNTDTGLYETPAAQTVRSKKIPRVLVKYPPTDKHPAQTETWQEDVPVGMWSVTKRSGALSPERQRILLDRITALQEAVKVAKEEANSVEVTDRKAGKAVFDFLFAT